MTETRVPAGVPTGGQFAASARAEATPGALVLADADIYAASREAAKIAYGLCAREDARGALVPATPYAEVSFDMREQVPHLDDAAFDQHLGAIARAAQFVSSAEEAESTDTLAYAEAALEGRVEECDYPVPSGEREQGGGSLDCDAYRAAVIEHWDQEIYAAVTRMVTEDLAVSGQHSAAVARPA